MKWLTTKRGDINWAHSQQDAVLLLTTTFLPQIIFELKQICTANPNIDINPDLFVIKLQKVQRWNDGSIQLINKNGDDAYNLSVRCESGSLTQGFDDIFNKPMAKRYDVIEGESFVFERMIKCPYWLIIHVQRFNNTEKIYNNMAFDVNLNMNQYVYNEGTQSKVCDDNDQFQYSLRAIIYHQGTANGGHYGVLYRRPDNRWYQINNEKVSRISNNAYRSTFGNQHGPIYQKTAVLLLYVQKHKEDTKLLITNTNPTILSNQLSNPSINVESQSNKLHFEPIINESEAVRIQREDWNKYIDVDKMRNLKCDESIITAPMRGILMCCTCGNGSRTAGMCAHRAFVLILLYHLITKEDYQERHSLSQKYANSSINIEPDFDSNIITDDVEPEYDVIDEC